MKRIVAVVLCLLALVPAASAETGWQEPDLVHYLILGFDFWGDEQIGVSYSDTNILATIDRANGRLMVTSLLRDTYIEKPDGKWTRMNNIVRSEGLDVMLETVRSNYGVDVDVYMAIGVEGVRRMIDEIGGVEVTVNSEEAEGLWNVKTITGPGTYHLDSNGVMHYMRLRKISGDDFGRTERQRKVLTQVLSQVSAMSLGDLAALGMTLFEEVETNMSLQDLMEAVSLVYSLRDAPLETLSLPVKGTYENATRHGMAVYELDWDANRQALQDFLYTKDTTMDASGILK